MATLPESTIPFPENQYTTLLEVSQAISSHQSLTELFDDLGRRLHAVLNFNYLSLILHDPEHEVMRIHTLHFDGVTTIRPGMEFGVDDSPSGEVWRTQRPFVVGEPEQASRFPRATRVLIENDLKSFCSLPLTTARRKIGTMNLGSSQKDAYRLSSMSLLTMVAAQVAVAVENALNYQEARELQQQVERERDRLKLLLDVNNAVVSNLALPELFRAISCERSQRDAVRCSVPVVAGPRADPLAGVWSRLSRGQRFYAGPNGVADVEHQSRPCFPVRKADMVRACAEIACAGCVEGERGGGISVGMLSSHHATESNTGRASSPRSSQRRVL
jgi:hypothetical protein